MLLPLYRVAGWLAPPVARAILSRRRLRGKEDPDRMGERMGRAGQPRPDGRLVWVHAASVGEAISALTLIDRLLDADPALNVLLTTGTVTSARLMTTRLPDRAIHQYVPLDCTAWVRRFLDHWRPDGAIWIESELWPGLTTEAAARGIPMALVNARMSERSFERWQRWPRAIRRLLSAFSLVLAQTETDADRYRALGASQARAVGNLKYAARPLPAGEDDVAALKAALGDRRSWIAASTHPGEERMIAAAHDTVRKAVPSALVIVVPRHPDRGETIELDLVDFDHTVARRAAGAKVLPETDIYIADTLGELGLFYRAVDLVFMGGTLVPHGGQNLLEPAALGRPVLFGPHIHNFQAIADRMAETGGARGIANAEKLGEAVAALLADDAARREMGDAAARAATGERHVLDDYLAALAPILPNGRPNAGA